MKIDIPARTSALLIAWLCAWSPSVSHAADEAPAGAGDPPLSVDAKADAADKTWEDYRKAVYADMIDGDSPREWALVSASFGFEFPDQATSPLQPTSAQLLQRAVERAPDDFLVQWIAAEKWLSTSQCSASPPPDGHVEALMRIEPDNAASSIPAIALASQRGNAAALDNALAHMATATRYDEHDGEAMHAWMNAFERVPVPDALLAVDDDPRPGDPEAIRFISAVAESTIGLPSYQSLVNACTPSRADGDWRRLAYCEDAARVMATSSKTLVAQTIGLAVLRRLGDGVMTEADLRMQRNHLWLRQSWMDLLSSDRQAETMKAYIADWRRSDNEIEIIRRALRRGGLPDEAPDGWLPAAQAAPYANPAQD